MVCGKLIAAEQGVGLAIDRTQGCSFLRAAGKGHGNQAAILQRGKDKNAAL